MKSLPERSFDVVALGEALVDMLPSQVGPLAEVPSFSRHAGGAPANVAIGVARLGGRVAFVGTVGADPFGEYLRTALHAEGIDVRAFAQRPGSRTGIAFVSLDASGRPRFLPAGSGGAELLLSETEAALAPIEDARFFHFGTFILMGSSSGAAALATARRARAAGTLVALDPNLRLHHWPNVEQLRAAVEEAVPFADMVKLSSDECEFVTGQRDPLAAAEALLDRGPRLVVVTTGPEGCIWARRGESGRVPGRPARVVDSTGAGDGFLAALLAGLSRRLVAGEDVFALSRASLEGLLAVAVECGARVCEHVGAVAGLPRKEELPDF